MNCIALRGGSSCPPAEQWLGQFTKSPELFTSFIPINFHVDYWDDLGWKDPYANAQFSKRQRRYNAFGHARTIATPGFIVNGKGYGGWFKCKKLSINNKIKVGRLAVTLEQNRNDGFGSADSRFEALNGAANDGRTYAEILAFDQNTKVFRGENRGKHLLHDFVVIGYKSQTAK